MADGIFQRCLVQDVWQLEDATAVIRSHGKLFRLLFVGETFTDVCQMWWDSITQSLSFYDPDEPEPSELTDNQKALREPIFTTLQEILEIPRRDCRISALHGLGHLQHPQTKAIIEEFLSLATSIDAEVHDYAVACIDGNIL